MMLVDKAPGQGFRLRPNLISKLVAGHTQGTELGPVAATL